MRSRELFNHREVTLQYRPFYNRSGVTWYWTLLPAAKNKSLGCGSASNKGRASAQARLLARRLGVRITKVETYQKPISPQAVEVCAS